MTPNDGAALSTKKTTQVKIMRKISVLQFICPSGFYGAEMWIIALAKNLEPQRVKCSLAITHESADQNIELYRRFRQLGLVAHQIEMQGRFDIAGILKLSRLIKKQKIDIIHTHGYKSDIMGLIAAKMTGIKSVTTPHGFENNPDLKLQLFIRLGCLGLKYLDRVVPLSEELKADILRIKVRPEKVRTIINGVDLEEIETQRQKNTPPVYPDQNEKKIGYVGQMAHRKNVGDLINTFDLLYREHKNIRLILIGEGPHRDNLEKKVKSLASASKIEFLGFRPDRLKLVKEMNLFCMTSSLEGIPRCMMEAMALEVPVAAFNIPGVDKLIIPEKTGLLAPFGDEIALKRCWERLLFDEELSSRMAQNGRDHVVKNFSAGRMAEEYTELYQEMMKINERSK